MSSTRRARRPARTFNLPAAAADAAAVAAAAAGAAAAGAAAVAAAAAGGAAPVAAAAAACRGDAALGASIRHLGVTLNSKTLRPARLRPQWIFWSVQSAALRRAGVAG